MSYKTLCYNLVQRIIGNLDKCSRNGDSNVVRSPWGIFKMYRSSRRGRFSTTEGATGSGLFDGFSRSSHDNFGVHGSFLPAERGREVLFFSGLALFGRVCFRKNTA